MAVVGRKPKPEDQRRNKNPPRHDWLEVVDVPYAGPRPECPVRLKATREWWGVISSMPHCALWTETDWRFAVDTSRVHALAFSPKGKSTLISEVRVREAKMGTTLDALRDLRIRYVSEAAPEEESGVTAIEDYRARLAE